MKTCLIKQPAGIGDIFLCQKIAKHYIDQSGYEVIWPVLSHLMWVQEYIKYPGITFVDVEQDFPYKDIYHSGMRQPYQVGGFIFLPLHTADQVFPHDLILDSKFKLVDMSINDWMDHFSFERNTDKERHLFYDLLGLEDKEDFYLTNSMYGTPPTQKTINIQLDLDMKRIELSLIDGITTFDWCMVLEKASEIHFVDTCYSLILNKMGLNGDNVSIYSRTLKPQIPSFSQTQHLFKNQSWNWIQL